MVCKECNSGARECSGFILGFPFSNNEYEIRMRSSSEPVGGEAEEGMGQELLYLRDLPVCDLA
jgi:hypothetical protein